MDAHDVNDTITAIGSAPGSGLRGIVRISGPRTQACLQKIFVRGDGKPLGESNNDKRSERKRPAPSVSSISGHVQLTSGQALPCELLWWPTNKSYTRQPTAEIHTLGAQPLLQDLLKNICQSGARLAQPGEFTLRAFLSGRIDLTQAEAVLAVIDADGQSQLDTALKQLAGGLAGPLGNLRHQLIGVLAELEAGLDFVEDDIEFISAQQLVSDLKSIEKHLQLVRSQISSRNQSGNAPKVVLFGSPNSGKSSLFNALSGSEKAIVSDRPGTTTDFISAPLDADSISLELIDTAGADTLSDPISQAAQVHRQEQQDQSDIRLFCIEAGRPPNQWELDQLRDASRTSVVSLTKSDLKHDRENAEQRIRSAGFHGPIVFTSSIQLTGIDALKKLISSLILTASGPPQSIVGSTVLRASECVREAHTSIQHAIDAAVDVIGNEIVAAEIRQTLEHLGQVVGAVYTDDILDSVFGQFCIGK